MHKGRPWGLPLEDRVLLVAAYWRTNLTLGQLALLFGVSKSAVALAAQPRKRFRHDAVLIVDGTLVPTRDHQVAEQSKNYRYSTGQPQRLQGMGTVRREGCGRQYHGDCGRRLSGHRPGHPAPP